MPFIAELFLLNEVGIEKIDLKHIVVFLPLFTISLILIYFFRVILLSHRTVKTQVMQLELRQTLCQFIQSYTDYSSVIKEKDSNALEKFENMIFSGILSDPGQLPSTFDGIEQISALVKSIRGS